MISFVIPARDEEANVARCVASIIQYHPDQEPYEILVVDNGSSDNTGEVARGAGAVVLRSNAPSIGMVRNQGAAVSQGDLLVFVDADCALTPAWQQHISDVLRKVRNEAISIAGSHPVPPTGEDVFLWRHWFVPIFQDAPTSHLGSAHMICRRDAFLALGGFDGRLVTSEDFDFCARVQRSGGSLFIEPQLTMIHYGFPRTWSGFFRRERWHGRGSAASIRKALASKVALMSVVFFLGLVISLVALLTGNFALGATGGAVVLAVVASSVQVKFRRASPTTKIAAAGIFCVFYSARALAIVDNLVVHLRRSSQTMA